MNHLSSRSKRPRIFLIALASALLLAPAHAETPGTILLKANAAEGVTLSGKARLGKPGGDAEFAASVGMADEPLVNLGAWSKPNPDLVKAVFAPDIPQAGYYEIHVRWFAGAFTGGCSDALPVRLETGHRDVTLRLNQRMGNVWVFLGTHRLEAGRGTRITFDATGTHGASNINAVRLVPTTAPLPQAKVLPGPADSSDPFVQARRRLADLLTPQATADVDDPVLLQMVLQEGVDAYFHWRTLNRAEGVKELWNDPAVGRDLAKNEGGGWPLVAQYRRITAMAKAYVGSSSSLGFASKMQGNPELLADILYALDFFYTHRFNERTVNKLGADWISNEINQPHEIATIINLIHPHVPPDFIAKQVATFEHIAPSPFRMYGGSGASTGFNRMFACYTYALRGLMANDAEKISIARDGIATEYRINRRSDPLKLDNGKIMLDGFYEDGTFIQHEAFPYIGIYGRGLLEYFGKIKALLAGSPWAVEDPGAEVFNRYVTEGYAPLFFQGDILYGSLGRSTGQSWHQNGSVSTEIISAIAPLVPLANSAESRAQLSGILKAWLLDKQNSAYPEFNRLDPQRLTLESYSILRNIVQDDSIVPLRPQPGTTVFYNSDYVVHHQPGFAAQLRMVSTRTKTHENLHQGTNKLGWYQGDGTLFLYNRDNSRYQDHFWATVNPYRLPGITVDPRSRAEDELNDGVYSESPWAGGVTLDDLGMASMGLKAVGSSLVARKSWFFVGDQILCLGAGISANEDRPIETIVENAKLQGPAAQLLRINGEATPTEPSAETVHRNVKWAHLEGSVPGGDLGWVFPVPATLHSLREDRTGSWVDSFRKDSPTPITRRYQTLWLNHGVKPVDATYAYILLPGRDAEQIRAYADKPELEILANTADLQAVHVPSRGVLAASFWSDKAPAVKGLQVNRPANILLVESPGELKLALSDPSQQTPHVTLQWSGNVTRVLESDPAITVESLAPLRLRMNTDKSDGRPLRIRFSR